MSRYTFMEVVMAIVEDEQYSQKFIYELNESSLKFANYRQRSIVGRRNSAISCEGPVVRLVWIWIILGLPFLINGQEQREYGIKGLLKQGKTEGIEFDKDSLKAFLQLRKLPLPKSIFKEDEDRKLRPVNINVPQGTKWQQIEIRIANDQRIEITYPGSLMEPWKPEEIGFANKRLLWPLFKQLATRSGKLKPQDFKPLKANISNIRTLLKELFPTISDGTPIKPYSKEFGYVCNFRLSISGHLSDHFMDDEDVKKASSKPTPPKNAEMTSEYYEDALREDGLSEDDFLEQDERHEDLMTGFRNER